MRALRPGERLGAEEIAELILAESRRARHEIDAREHAGLRALRRHEKREKVPSGLHASASAFVLERKLTGCESPPAALTMYAFAKSLLPSRVAYAIHLPSGDQTIARSERKGARSSGARATTRSVGAIRFAFGSARDTCSSLPPCT